MSTPSIPFHPVTLHLLSLSTSLPKFLTSLSNPTLRPLLIAKVGRWIHAPNPTATTNLTTQDWDILLVLPDTSSLSSTLTEQVRTRWSISAKVPRELVDGFAAANTQLLHPNPCDVLPILKEDLEIQRTSDDDISISITPEIDAWARSLVATEGRRPVTMLNLLAYENKEKYQGYIQAFAEGFGAKYGAVAKMIGEVSGTDDSLGTKDRSADQKWDDIALVQYPSIDHFVAMVKSEEYKELDRKWKRGALRDTGLLCVVEMDLPGGE